MHRRSRVQALSLFLPLLTTVVWLSLPSPLQAQPAKIHWGGARHLRFDVAENGKRFTPDETPVHPGGLPAYGNEFITEGYIYPYGTLDGANGVNDDGSPEFPDKVIGKWYCRGWHVGDGALTATGPWVVTHQLYDLGDEPGRTTLASDGIELADLNVPFRRAITGGTGRFSDARGQVTQTFLRFPNAAGGGNFRFVLEVSR